MLEKLLALFERLVVAIEAIAAGGKAVTTDKAPAVGAPPGKPAAAAKPGAAVKPGATKPGATAASKPGAAAADLNDQGAGGADIPYDTVRDLVMKVSSTKGRQVAIDALARFGVTSAKDLVPDQFSVVVADLESILGGSDGGLA